MFKGKKLLLVLTIILMVSLGVALVACDSSTTSDDDGIAGISVVTKHNGAYVLGDDIDLSEITILVTYKNGETKTVTVSDNMFSTQDRELFFTKGTHTVFIKYEGTSTALQIAVVGIEDAVIYTAEFKSNGGSLVDSQRGTVINTFYAPQRPGYTFDGWYTNYDLTGDKVKAPYKLTQNTVFYAKWVDNRRCTITFVDFFGETVKEFEIVYGTSINVNDLNTYPAPEEIEGMIFSGWSTSGGNTEEVTANLTVTAVYVSKDCIVQIYTDADENSTPRIYQKKYGDSFDVNTFVLPTREGHVSRWVVYKNDETTFEELPANGIITVREEKIVIKSYHVINTYNISIQNGLASQTYADLKAGNIKTAAVYKDPSKNQNYSVNYGSNFNISNFTETPYLVTPQTINGYNAVWCLVVPTLTGEIWYNAYNQIWNETTQRFEAAESGVASQYQLKDEEGNYLATVRGNNENPELSVLISVDNVKANIIIKPKYIKKNYTVVLRRNINNAWTELDSFSVPYLSDFKLYDPNMADYQGLGYVSSEDVERSYLYKNVAPWLAEVNWNDIYWRSDSGLVDDWTIEWFSSPDMSTNTKIDFTEVSGRLGSVEISDNFTLYCKDTDQRRYDVYLYYDYDFSIDSEAPLSEIYKKRVIFRGLKENDPITLPADYSAPITRTYDYNGRNYYISYIFKGWYDFRYNDPSGYTGSLQNPGAGRNRNLYFYAHYECTTTYNLLVYDKTQKTAYNGRVGFENLGYDVQEESIFYQLNAGDIFDSRTMLFKGRTLPGSNTSGQVFYQRYTFIEWFDNELTPSYNNLLSLYGGNKSAAISTLNAHISGLNEELATCEGIWSALYSYNYGTLDKESYESGILTAEQYNQKQKQKKIYQDELALIESYDANMTTRNNYAADMSVYKLYTDSAKTLNYAYEYTDADIEEDNVKYKFLGWYLDENYATLYKNEIDFEWFVTGENLTLYAKWADQEKGTEGLVFQKLVINGEIVLAVVDFINAATYNTSIYYGSGYNDLENKYYSLNLNDQGNMPINLGTNLDIQIPKEHGGDNTGGYPVIGILAEAFKKFSNSIKSVAMPGTLMFIEERAFYNCNLENFYISGSLYIEADDSRALYQKQSYVVAPEDIDTVGRLQTTGINVQANTLLSYANRSAKDYLTVLSGTTRIANNAFSGASNLKYIDLGNSLIAIGDYALEATALIGHYDTANTIGTDTLIFPSTLTTIGNYAFKDTVNIRYIQFSGVSSLNHIGFNAFKSTNWYNSKIGPIILNNNLIGVRNGNETHFEKDGNGQIIYYGINNDQARIISGNNYLYYEYKNNRYSLCKIEVYDAITSIASGAFLDFSSVYDIYFYDCSALSIIYGKAFENCTNIENVYIYGATNTLSLAEDVFKNCPILNVYVPNVNNLHSSFDDYEGLINLINL